MQHGDRRMLSTVLRLLCCAVPAVRRPAILLASSTHHAAARWQGPHLVQPTPLLPCAAVGLGGVYGISTPWRLLDNPGAWALCFGEDFHRFNSLPTMDYAVAHMWETNRGSWVSRRPGPSSFVPPEKRQKGRLSQAA